MSTLLYMRPQWPVKHRWELKTDVVTMRDGSEQRIALMSSPRESFDLRYILEDADIRMIEPRLINNPDGAWLLPMWHEAIRIGNSSFTAGSSTIRVVDETYLDWLTVGQNVLISWQNGNYQLTSIDSFSSPNIGLADPLDDDIYNSEDSDVPFMHADLCPVVEVLLQDGASWGKYAVNAAEWMIRPRVKDLATVFGTGGSLTTLDDIYVMTKNLTAGDLVQESHLAGLDVFDEGFSIDQLFVGNRGEIHRDLTVNLRSRADHQWWKKFITSVRGRQVPFLCPTWAPDLVHNTGTISAAATSLVVKSGSTFGDYVADHWPLGAASHRVQIYYSGGAIDRRAVHKAVDNGNGTQTLTVDAMTGGTVGMISRLEWCRLADDVVERNYESPKSAHATIPVVVTQCPSELPETASDFYMRTGLTMVGAGSSLYVFDELSGNTIDRSGNNTTLIDGGPTLIKRVLRHRRRGWQSISGSPSASSVNVPWESGQSFIIGTCSSFYDAAAYSVNGRVMFNTLGGSLVELYLPDVGGRTLGLFATDGGGSYLTYTIVPPAFDKTPYLCLGQFDMAAKRMYVLYARNGSYESNVALMPAWGGLTGTIDWYFGGNDGFAHTDYNFTIVGSQCEGADVLPELARSLGFL